MMFSRIKTAIGRVFGFQARREREDRTLLLRMCFGDAATADRLIAGERSRNPGISEAQACRRAIQAIQRDNR
jgi:hypothetical protein